jgi:hypothetical protein
MLKGDKLKDLIERSEFYMRAVRGGVEYGDFRFVVNECGLIVGEILRFRSNMLKSPSLRGPKRNLIEMYKELEVKVGKLDWDIEKVAHIEKISREGSSEEISKEMADYAILSMEKVKEYIIRGQVGLGKTSDDWVKVGAEKVIIQFKDRERREKKYTKEEYEKALEVFKGTSKPTVWREGMLRGELSIECDILKDGYYIKCLLHGNTHIICINPDAYLSQVGKLGEWHILPVSKAGGFRHWFWELLRYRNINFTFEHIEDICYLSDIGLN